jgi:hypothetical protein
MQYSARYRWCRLDHDNFIKHPTLYFLNGRQSLILAWMGFMVADAFGITAVSIVNVVGPSLIHEICT